MDQLEVLATLAVFVTLSVIVGFLIGKRQQSIPKNKVLVERITYDYLRERDELLTSVQSSEQKKHERSRVMYAVKDYVWNN